MSGGGSRLSIPNGTWKMIENIKEITGNHSEEDIYAMLKECSMDPNETTQKLLLQDTFHEVKRKRDRKKENQSDKEVAESWFRSGTQGWGNRGGRVNHTPRYILHVAGGGKNSIPGKDNGGGQVVDKAAAPSVRNSQEPKNKEITVTSAATIVANGPTSVDSGSMGLLSASSSSARIGVNAPELSTQSIKARKYGNASAPSATVDSKKAPAAVFGFEDMYVQPTPSTSEPSVPKTPATSSADCFSSSDTVLLPCSDTQLPGSVGTIQREVGSPLSLEPNASASVVNKSTSVSETGGPLTLGKMPGRSLGVAKQQFSMSSQSTSASTHGSSSGSRPSSNYNNPMQQSAGPQKVNTYKEWKPKSTNPSDAGGLISAGTSEASAIPVEGDGQLKPVSIVIEPEEAASDLQTKMEEMHLQQRQHVILPRHIHVPESERSKLTFGSFDAICRKPAPESEKSSTPESERSQLVEENVGEQILSNQNARTPTEVGDYADISQSPKHAPEILPSREDDVSSSPVPDYGESNKDSGLLSGGLQCSVVHTFPNSSTGFVPPVLGGQLPPIENSESQSRDTSHLPNIFVQPSIDPTTYYANYYRAGPESDGCISPFPAPGVATKYSGNVAVFPVHATQSPQESGNSIVLTTAAQTPLVTQAAGLMHSSLAATHQPVPVFHPPPGVPISHFPANYIPYGHYLSPFYVAPAGIHPFLGNSVFPPQPQAASAYPAAPATATVGMKYPLSHYKSGTNIGNPAHLGMPSAYGPYGSSPTGYNPGSATTGSSTTNEDLSGSQFKESNVYVTGQQNDASAVWMPAPSRDISSLSTASYYNPTQGYPRVTFTPTQANHGTFAGLYHPAQAVNAAPVHPLLQQSQTVAGAADMVGAAANVYQQHAQSNWPNNF